MNNRIYLTPQDDFQPMRMIPISAGMPTRSPHPGDRWAALEAWTGPTSGLVPAQVAAEREKQEQAKTTQQAVVFGGALLLGMLIAWLAFSKPAPVYVIIPPT